MHRKVRRVKLKKKKVLFLPYAGGSTLNYQSCFTYFPEEIEPISIELAGRGKRFNEPFYKNIDEATDDILERLEKELNGDEYVIFGHSMGAVLTFELYFKIKKKGLQVPKCVVLSGRSTPNTVHSKIDIKNYDDETFIKLVSFYGGLPENFENSELKALFLPIIRADFEILDEYVFEEKKEKIESDMLVLFGKRDFSAPEREARKWEEFAGAGFSFYGFPGGHFFINDYFEEIARMIVEQFSTAK